MTSNAIVVDSLWKKFRLYHERNQYLKSTITKGRRAQYEDFWALKDVSFEIPIGQTFGIIGANGSGKSTLLKCLAGILTPDKGSLITNGRTAALLELGAGFHPDLSGRENISLNGAILGMTRREIERKFESIVSFAGLEQFIDTPVKNYSSGMVVRLGFAVAINVEPEILIIDEVLAVGDEEFQQRCFQKIEDFRRDGRTIIFVSHGLGQVSQLCEEALWLEKGTVRTVDSSYKVVAEYTGESHQIHFPVPAILDIETPVVVDEEAPIHKNRWGSGEVRIDSVA
ncbi:MAG: ABC transporter ATP-binding protein, partial [Fimbriimonadaceae bacterium]|nr:ABC transporter ATP-binding protein [Fimbriimonadaceae bacterium]